MTDSAGQHLTVDAASGNSPYNVNGTSDNTWATVIVGNTGTGVINQIDASAPTFTVTSALTLGYASTGSGTYNLSSGTLALGTGSTNIGYGGTGNFTQSGSSAVTGSGNFFLGFQAGSLGTYTLQGPATFSTGQLAVGHSSTGNSTFTQNGGTVTLTNGLGVGVTAGTMGTYILSSGTLMFGSAVARIGDSGTGTFAQSGSSAVSATANFYLGYGGGGAGKYTLQDTATLGVGTLYVGYGSTGNSTFAQSGGTVTSTGGFNVGYGSGTNGTYTLSGGTLQTAIVNSGSGNSTFNFNGGTLRAQVAIATFVTGLTTASIQAGGAIIDSQGFALTIPQALVTGTVGTPDGGLTKIGMGTLTLSGNNTYAGATNVNAGTLREGVANAFSTRSLCDRGRWGHAGSQRFQHPIYAVRRERQRHPRRGDPDLARERKRSERLCGRYRRAGWPHQNRRGYTDAFWQQSLRRADQRQRGHAADQRQQQRERSACKTAARCSAAQARLPGRSTWRAAASIPAGTAGPARRPTWVSLPQGP